MKGISVLVYLLSISLLGNGQKEFSTKQEAFVWLKDAFSKYFVNNPNGEQAEENYEYELTDKYLLITANKRSGKKIKVLGCVLVPIDRVLGVYDMSSSSIAYKKAASLRLSTGGRACQQTDKKGFQGEGKYDQLTDGVTFPFHIDGEAHLIHSMDYAFFKLSR